MRAQDEYAALTSALAASFASIEYVVELDPRRIRHLAGELVDRLRASSAEAEDSQHDAVGEALFDDVWEEALSESAPASRLGGAEIEEVVCYHVVAPGDSVRLLHRFVRRIDNGRTLIVGAAADTTDDWRIRESLEQSEALYREVAENSADFAMRTTPDRVVEYVSNSVTGVMGWRPEELVGRHMPELLHPDDQQLAADFSDRLNRGEPVFLRTRFKTKTGDWVWMAQHVKPILSEDGRVVARAGVWRDVSSEMRSQAALEESEQRFRLAMHSAPSGIALVGSRREFRAVNPALCRILQRDEAWLLDHRMDDIVHPEDDALERSLHAGRGAPDQAPPSAELRCLRADGEPVWVAESVGSMQGADGEDWSVVHIVDITDARAANERLRFLASHDDLTGQLRPAALNARLGELLAQHADGSHGRLVAIFVDVDGLKTVNDSFGHEAGDEVIRTAATRIGAAVRRSDLVARIGGDEFVVVLNAVHDLADAERVAAKLQETFGEPITIKGQPLRMSLSMGIAEARPDDDVDGLLRRADVALYASKAAGRARATVFTDDMTDG
ncbi:MAG: PAS domain S-box protein [Actinobacteria bacterium]|nr:PAS domain S-box protein [Actinomycetota bacterium]MCB9412415.1 PAS domain S-box protein [Actinomycetota bacterium]